MQLLRVERNASCRWDLAFDRAGLCAARPWAVVGQICGIKPEVVAVVGSRDMLAGIGLGVLGLV